MDTSHNKTLTTTTLLMTVFLLVLTNSATADKKFHLWYNQNELEYRILLPEKTISQAKKEYGYLSHKFNSTLYNTKILSSPNILRQMIANNLPETKLEICKSRTGTIKTSEGQNVHYTFFDRDSDTLLVIGPGFGFTREQHSAPFIAMFPNYDIVTYDHLWHGLDHIPNTRVGRFTNRLAKSNLTCAQFTRCATEEINSILDNFADRNKYDQIFGIGVCYSTASFAKVATRFDKLILDGAWPHASLLATGFARRKLKCCAFLAPLIAGMTPGIKRGAFSKKKSINTLPIFKTLHQPPTLFIHSLRDDLITLGEFEQVWESVPCQNKLALLLPARHILGPIKYKELVALAGHTFFETPYKEAVESLMQLQSDTNK